ncbi:MAG: hypothetical protein AMJ79_01640 [Phycisphaerae bacterium SM23_30]|nr:MAG: hypothetical protein AMJ79_01640 [Phycisphaerae bacterium SM23_30]
MRIDDYGFGWIVIDGQRYKNDVIIAGGRVIPNWWRQEGHLLAPEDLDAVIQAGPNKLIVGTGMYGRMTIPEATNRFLSDRGIVLETGDTKTAGKKYNESAAAGENVAAVLHLTC